jgi:hypothetical protein
MAREGSLTLAEELLARAAHTFGRIGADLERARTLRETRALVVP